MDLIHSNLGVEYFQAENSIFGVASVVIVQAYMDP